MTTSRAIMPTQTFILSITFIYLITAFAQPPQDAFDRVLAPIGLTNSVASAAK